MTEVISVYDDGVRLDIPFEACVLYHGRDSIGGLSLGYRLLRFALNKLTDGRIPERKEITFKTAFPGPGLRDAGLSRERLMKSLRTHRKGPLRVSMVTCILRLLWALERFVVPLNRVFFRKSSYKREERSRKVIIPSRMRVTGESKRTPSPRRFGIFLTLRMFCLFQ